jgi:hypothetical protein
MVVVEESKQNGPGWHARRWRGERISHRGSDVWQRRHVPPTPRLRDGGHRLVFLHIVFLRLRIK